MHSLRLISRSGVGPRSLIVQLEPVPIAGPRRLHVRGEKAVRLFFPWQMVREFAQLIPEQVAQTWLRGRTRETASPPPSKPLQVVGYAATARLRTGEPPIVGGIYHERTDWWNSILQMPSPRIVVLEDMDDVPGIGAFFGGMHGAILRGLGCVACVTNGAVRELPRVRALGLQAFAGNVAVSHSYAHIFDFGSVVRVGGLEIRPGDLLHGDMHGLLTIPRQVAGKVPRVATKLRQFEEKVIAFCQSREFSLEQLHRMLQELS